jgi:6,7-dimethyl-8-ribityllumazine synthase
MKSTYDISTVPQAPGSQIAILQSEWYSEYTDECIKHCKAILADGGAASPELHRLPGALELPFAARQVARQTPNLDAIVVFGIILRGETQHFDMIVNMISRGFERVMFEENIPIIVEVLPVENIEQARARCADDDSNKGREAALAALKMIQWRRSLTTS